MVNDDQGRIFIIEWLVNSYDSELLPNFEISKFVKNFNRKTLGTHRRKNRQIEKPIIMFRQFQAWRKIQ